MMRILQRYKTLLAIIFSYLLLIMLKPKLGLESVSISIQNLREVLIILPPIFILLGLLDSWVPRETILKLMGDKSGLLGMMIAFLLGSVAAGPLYAAFPIAGVLLKKGSKFTNILIFIGAWSTTKIPLMLFEASSMGWKFMATRFMIDIPGIIFIAYLTEKMMSTQEKALIYENAEKLE